jgi:alcohol dehydrogenase
MVEVALQPTLRLRDDPGSVGCFGLNGLVYYGPNEKAWLEVADPKLIDSTDALVAVDQTTICGSDLHIVKGELPEVTRGRILGHEAVGTVLEVGPAVMNLKPGDRILVSCITSCGRCSYCRQARFGQCLTGGWLLGHHIDGTQAEKVRVPYADTSTYLLPDGVIDEEFLMLADILPTGYEVGAINGGVSPGDVVVVIGAGPIGLAAITGSLLFSPSHIVAVDLSDARLEVAKQFGADVVVNSKREDALDLVRSLTRQMGADVAIEAVGKPATFELAAELVRPGGRIANIGVHGVPATLHLERLWSRDVTIRTGLVDTSSTPTLSKLIATRQVDAGRFITHHYPLAMIAEAYDLFASSADNAALKVVLTNHNYRAQPPS